MAENSPNSMKETNLPIQEVQQTSSRPNSKRTTPRHHNQTVKRQSLESSTREVTHHVKVSSIRLTARLIKSPGNQKAVRCHI